jgi:hypothetical protein
MAPKADLGGGAAFYFSLILHMSFFLPPTAVCIRLQII